MGEPDLGELQVDAGDAGEPNEEDRDGELRGEAAGIGVGGEEPVREVGVVSDDLKPTAYALMEEWGVSDAAGNAVGYRGAPDKEVVEDIEASEGEPGRDMEAEERVARDPDCLVVGSEPGGTRDALRHGCLRVGVETSRREDAGGVDAHGRQIGDKAHDRPDVEFGCRELQHVQARDRKIVECCNGYRATLVKGKGNEPDWQRRVVARERSTVQSQPPSSASFNL